MDFKVQFALLVLFVAFTYTHARCPANGQTWYSDIKDDEERCILRCTSGEVPTGCHVIRPNGRGGFNNAIPTCVKASLVTGKTMTGGIGVAVAAVAVVSLLLSAVGFTRNGVAAGSIAAFIQVPFTLAGGLFAAAQSAGAAGMAMSTMVCIGGAALIAYIYVINTFTGCEQE